jgi:hypothetical protein
MEENDYNYQKEKGRREVETGKGSAMMHLSLRLQKI